MQLGFVLGECPNFKEPQCSLAVSPSQHQFLARFFWEEVNDEAKQQTEQCQYTEYGIEYI